MLKDGDDLSTELPDFNKIKQFAEDKIEHVEKNCFQIALDRQRTFRMTPI